jgi:hypothetical protein
MTRTCGCTTLIPRINVLHVHQKKNQKKEEKGYLSVNRHHTNFELVFLPVFDPSAAESTPLMATIILCVMCVLC